MPAVHRKPPDGGLLGSLNARAAAGSRGVDNFASISTYYRRASLLLRQVGCRQRRRPCFAQGALAACCLLSVH